MPHRNATAEEIRAEIQRRVWDHDLRNNNRQQHDVPMLEPIDVENTGGSHWTISFIPDTEPESRERVLEIVREVMTEYELIDWWQWSVILHPVTFRQALESLSVAAGNRASLS